MTKTHKNNLIITWKNAYVNDLAYYQIQGGEPLTYIEYTQKYVIEELPKEIQKEILTFLNKEYKYYEKKIQTNNKRNSL